MHSIAVDEEVNDGWGWPNVHNHELRSHELHPCPSTAEAFAPTPIIDKHDVDTLRALIPSHVNIEAFTHQLTTSNLHVRINNDLSTDYELCPEILSDFVDTYEQLGKITMCAAHDFNPLFDPIETIPHYIPRSVLQEWGAELYLPHIRMAFDANFLEPIRHSEPEPLLQLYQQTQDCARAFARWIMDRIAIQIRKGYQSEVNFGAFFGLTKTEFFNRVSPEVVTRAGAHPADGETLWADSSIITITNVCLNVVRIQRWL